jgi:hypothetical protein
MNGPLTILVLVLSPVFLFSQSKSDTAAIPPRHSASSYVLMFNVGTVFYTAKDARINKFMGKYGYAQQQDVPVGLKIELVGMPFGGKMIYSINASTVVSKQDILSADLSIGAYYRFLETGKFWFTAGIALGEHFDRIYLNGKLPPALDSLAKKYNASLSLHRTGSITEPAVKIFWFPIQTKNFQLGLFTAICYDFDFNSRWRVGYYPKGSNLFKNLRKPTDVGTTQQFGWVFNTGLSVCF